MKKIAVVVSAFALFMLVLAVVPVMAAPTEGQKVEIEMKWTPIMSSIVVLENRLSNDVTHRHVTLTWNVELKIVGGDTYVGTAFNDRVAVYVPQEDGQNRIFRDYYELSFPSEGGGFKGNAMVFTPGWVAGVYEGVKTHGVFHGTDNFEGQTINAGAMPWEPYNPSMVWPGYLLKP